VYFRDMLRRAHQQVDPADKVQPRLNIQDLDEDTLSKILEDLFHITDPEVCARLAECQGIN
jgi:hypothetical protein